MPAFRDADLNTKAHSTSMPTFLAFRLTVFCFFFVIPLHSLGNPSYTRKGHICFSQTIWPPLPLTSPLIAHIWGYHLAWNEPTGSISSEFLSW